MAKQVAQDRIGRRSRFERSPTGKRVMLTERDTEILRWLYRYRFLRATQLLALVSPKSEKRFIERLGDLYHETGLIDRPVAQWRRFDARYQPIIYEVSGKGLDYLADQGEPPHRAVTFAKHASGRNTAAAPHFEHAMMIVDALVEVELITRKAKGQCFVPVDEILERMPDETRAAKHPLAVSVTVGPNDHLPVIKKPTAITIIPDALYGIGFREGGEWLYRFYALECENRSPKSRSTVKLSSLALKQAAYEALIRSRAYRTAWRIPCLEMEVTNRKQWRPRDNSND